MFEAHMYLYNVYQITHEVLMSVLLVLLFAKTLSWSTMSVLLVLIYAYQISHEVLMFVLQVNCVCLSINA